MNHDHRHARNRLLGVLLQSERGQLDPSLSEAGLPVAVLIRAILVERIREVADAVEGGE